MLTWFGGLVRACVCVLLRNRPRATCLLGKYSDTELHSDLKVLHMSNWESLVEHNLKCLQTPSFKLS